MSDSYFTFTSYFADIEECFKIDSSPPRELPFKNSFQNAMTFELLDSKQLYIRSVYSVLDLLAQVGGLKTMFGTLCTVIVIIF